MITPINQVSFKSTLVKNDILDRAITEQKPKVYTNSEDRKMRLQFINAINALENDGRDDIIDFVRTKSSLIITKDNYQTSVNGIKKDVKRVPNKVAQIIIDFAKSRKINLNKPVFEKEETDVQIAGLELRNAQKKLDDKIEKKFKEIQAKYEIMPTTDWGD